MGEHEHAMHEIQHLEGDSSLAATEAKTLVMLTAPLTFATSGLCLWAAYMETKCGNAILNPLGFALGNAGATCTNAVIPTGRSLNSGFDVMTMIEIAQNIYGEVHY